jgi:hypothetical protein
VKLFGFWLVWARETFLFEGDELRLKLADKRRKKKK